MDCDVVRLLLHVSACCPSCLSSSLLDSCFVFVDWVSLGFIYLFIYRILILCPVHGLQKPHLRYFTASLILLYRLYQDVDQETNNSLYHILI